MDLLDREFFGLGVVRVMADGRLVVGNGGIVLVKSVSVEVQVMCEELLKISC